MYVCMYLCMNFDTDNLLALWQVSLRNALAGKNLVVALPDTRVSPWTSKTDFLKVC
jgi:hypothetical protein